MRFMLKATWKEEPNETVLALLPAEETRAQELAEQGIQEALYIPADNSGAWAVWSVSSEAEIQEVAQTLPLYEYLDFEVSLLAEDA